MQKEKKNKPSVYKFILHTQNKFVGAMKNENRQATAHIYKMQLTSKPLTLSFHSTLIMRLKLALVSIFICFIKPFF